MLSRQAIIAGVVWVLSSSVEVSAQSSSCDSLTVAGGILPGTYLNTGTLRGGKDLFAQATDGSDLALLGFYEGTATGRERRLNDGLDGALGANGALGELLDRHSVSPDMREARHAAGEQSLAQCATGFWINLISAANATGVDDLTFPIYLSTDCSDSPADISAGWFVLECEACDPVPVVGGLTIECDIADTAAVTPAPTSPGDTSPPVSERAVPTPAPEAADDDDGLCSEITVTGGGLPGVYPFFNIIGDKAFYGDATAGIGWLDISNLRRRVLAADAGGDAGHVNDLDRIMLSNVLEGGAFHTLAACSTEIWYMTEDPNANPVTFPVYITPDCADHVLDATTPWFVIAKEGGSPAEASPQPVLTCTAEGGGSSGTPSPAAAGDNPDQVGTTPTTSSPSSATDTEGASSASGLFAVGNSYAGVVVISVLAGSLAVAFLG